MSEGTPTRRPGDGIEVVWAHDPACGRVQMHTKDLAIEDANRVVQQRSLMDVCTQWRPTPDHRPQGHRRATPPTLWCGDAQEEWGRRVRRQDVPRGEA